MELTDKFDPVRYSEEETVWLLEHLGDAPVVAERTIPPHFPKKALMEEIERIYKVIELERVDKRAWCGLEACKAALQNYQTQVKKWQEDWRRTRGAAPLVPPMYSYDSKGRPHRGGPGSDSGIVKTYFDAQGNRHPIAIDIYPEGDIAWQPEWVVNKGTDQPGNGLFNDVTNSRVECKICGHTEKYNVDSRSSYNAARGRISKHLRTAKDHVDEHRECQTLEFGS